jgi:hypothetical protein
MLVGRVGGKVGVIDGGAGDCAKVGLKMGVEGGLWSMRGEGCLWPAGEELAWRLRGAAGWWNSVTSMSEEVLVVAAKVSGGMELERALGVLEGPVGAAEDAAE